MPRSAPKKSAAARKSFVRPSSQQAENLRRSRRDRAVETAQDYVEAIADLSVSLGEARVVDLSRRLGVTHVTVNRTLARLRHAGYVNTKPYRAIFLTDTGRKLADECKRRHETVAAFLRKLGVSEKIAELDAEGIEHHVSPKTLAAFERWLKKN
ncbi:MAG TPA: manganese-binding transcriptional regulator MntR [Verrucomicrobiae bacterium]|jgi:DtxR family manganese transport transcriptional regulator|nr:manganese-binding transcriptional regulator MntR [Verrucomicrobiae bacterium]